MMDINCDMGEGMATDELIMPFIHTANIALGYHAGDAATIRKTIELCVKNGVHAGAHPSFDDRDNFGRTEHHLSEKELYNLLTTQLHIFSDALKEFNLPFHHVKPHGALYNQSAKNPTIARVIATAVKEFDDSIILFGLSGSHSITEAEKAGLKTWSEVFADRSYQDDGSLTPRSMSGALIESRERVIEQANEFKNGFVTTLSGKKIPLKADTICVHGDGKNAVEFARAIYHLAT